jgi:hypothetical protein
VSEDFVDIRKEGHIYFFVYLKHEKNCLLFTFYGKKFSYSILISIAKNSGNYTKFTTPTKQQPCLQKAQKMPLKPSVVLLLKG